MKTKLMLSAIFLMACGAQAQAGLINFESGFADQQAVNSPIDTGDNMVTISTTGSAGNPSGLSYIAQVGSPRTAFTTGSNPAIANDEAVDGRAGTFFLTDENTVDTNIYASDYVFSFADGITELGLDIFDFRVDGGAASVGNSATAILTLFSDAAMTDIIGQTSFTATLENQPIDGNAETLFVMADGVAVKAMLTLGGADRGVGVDNINFVTQPPLIVTVPEPSSFVLLGVGAIGLLGLRRRQRSRQTA